MSEMIKGAHAVAEAAIRAGCRFFAGYPITPQTEILEYMAAQLPSAGGVFVQAESEITAICMAYGASAAGVRSMSASSGPGFSLMQEGISYAAAARLPLVIVDVMRCVPGLGTIDPAQSDYLQATKGGGHGDYRCLVLAPSSVQEAADLTYLAFEVAERHRLPCIVLLDGALAQMFESAELPPAIEVPPRPRWAIDGKPSSAPKRIGMTVYVNPAFVEDMRDALASAWASEQRHEAYLLADAETVIVAYGVVGRVAKGAVDLLRRKGRAVGLFRPVSLWPFPTRTLRQCCEGTRVRRVVVAEMSLGQLVDDVMLALRKTPLPVHLLSRPFGRIPLVDDVAEFVEDVLSGKNEEVIWL